MSTKAPQIGLEIYGALKEVKNVVWNAGAAELYEEAIRNNEGVVSENGALVTKTGSHTGRSVNDRFVVKETSSEKNIWWGKVNRPISEEHFNGLYAKVQNHLKNKKLYVQDCKAGADPSYRLPVRVVTETAWHSLFARNMFIQLPVNELATHKPDFTVLHAPSLKADPKVDGTNSSTFIVINFGQRIVLIGGTEYAGEIKKSIFSVLNYLLPLKGVMTMHCSANVGKSVGQNGDVALFFGLSGTGKTSLSTDPERLLIGDDEHGWSDSGVFNFEGGCYAKVIRLSKESEADIYACTRRFGTILENVDYDAQTRVLDLNSDKYTENTRASYPINFIDNALLTGRGEHPKNIIFLTCDSFGIMPPVAKLSTEQALYYFINGYTARVAGTEAGVGKEPQAVFSPCYGAPFMALHPSVYANLLRKKIDQQGAHCWLINTGWTGGAYGVGERIKIQYTRALVHAALNGSLSKVAMVADPVFGFQIPQSCPGVPANLLNPQETWGNKEAYKSKSLEVANKFVEHFKGFAEQCTKDICSAGPRI